MVIASCLLPCLLQSCHSTSTDNPDAAPNVLPSCGNGVVEDGEVCDQNCPSYCDDGDTCTNDSLTGSVKACDAQCIYTPVVTCVNGDSCCPVGCKPDTDTDCISTIDLRHGMWVYKLTASDPLNPGAPAKLLETDPDTVTLRQFCGALGITELYLSTSRAALSHANLPRFIRSLKKAGYGVEALIDQDYYDELDKIINEVIAFNNAQDDPQARFNGIHLDIEPWIGTGTDYSWVEPLLDKYRLAQQTLANSNLSLAADLAGFKLVNEDSRMVAHRQDILDTVTRVVLMQYQADEETVHLKTDALFDWADLSTATVMVAIRVKDFGATSLYQGNCQNGQTLFNLDKRYKNTTGYIGWATFSYNAYYRLYENDYPDIAVADQPICPQSNCCTTLTSSSR